MCASLRDARFGFVFSRRGIVPEAASSWFLPRLVGIARRSTGVTRAACSGADEALAGGLVEPRRRAGRTDAGRPRAGARVSREDRAGSVALTRQMMWRMLGAAHPMEAHRVDSRAIFHRGKSADVKEGVASFLEKRPAHFTETVSADMPELPWGEEPGYR